MEKTHIEEGLVGFFDILGYQSFLENNDAEVATSEVLNIINDVGDIIGSKILNLMEAPDTKDEKIVGGIQWLVFSDTILMLMKWDKKNIYEWTVFNMAASTLCQHMFEFGLPLRGAIRTGKYLLSKSCFAGRTIVEAYRAETSLNLAACVVDEEVVNLINSEFSGDIEVGEIVNSMMVKYMTPLSDDQYKKLLLLNYMIPDRFKPNPIDADIRQMVLNSFWAHNKDITPSAEIKAQNTENFFRYLQNRFPNFYGAKSA
jgi:hypothetical protein